MAVLPLLFALTGATALAYQLVWSRFLALAFGGTLATTSAVVAWFLAGLALGSVVFGRLADRLRRPLYLYAALEVGVSLLAFASPGAAASLTAVVPAEARLGTLLGLTAVYLLPPTFLMGGTFPALLATVPTRPGAAALLYGANTTGAVLGVLLAAFFLLPRLGLTRSVTLCATLNLAVALGALLLARRLPPSPSSPRPLDREVDRAVARFALLALGLSGAAALLGEIAWMRALSLLLGSSVYAFAIVLGALLLGIGLGSLRYARRPPPGHPLEHIVHFELRAATAAAVFAVLLIAGPRFLVLTLEAGKGDPWTMAAAAFAIAFAATGYATTALGAAFPAGIAAILGSGPPGRSCGRAYAANTVGAVAGALGTAALAIPHLGLARTLALGVVLNLAAAAAAARFRRRVVAVAVAGSAVALVALPAWWRSNQEVLARVSGVYAYAYKYAPAPPNPTYTTPRARTLPRPAAGRSRVTTVAPGLVFVGDGTHANVAVYRDRSGDLELRIDGKVDASTSLSGDMRTQLLLGHLPVLFHRGPVERALVIGLGSGVTASALLAQPQTRIDVVELEPLVARVAREYFRPANRAVLESERVRLVIGDGRNWVAKARDRYDILTSEPSNLWMSGVANLFTDEFFAEAARALKADGILCQWMHLYQVSPTDVQIVLRGLRRSFPHAALFVDGSDLLILASLSPLPDPKDVPFPAAVADDLGPVGIRRPEDLATLYLGDAGLLGRFAGTGPLHTDDHPVLEFTAPLSLARNRSAEIVALLEAAEAHR